MTLRNCALALLILIIMSSCAALIHGSKQKVTVTSDPPGAHVYLNGVDTKTVTPGKITVSRKSGTHDIKFERPGFQDFHFLLQSRFNGLVLLDFAFILPGIIDVAVGSQNVFDKVTHAPMVPEQRTLQDELVMADKSKGKRQYTFNRISDVDMGVPEVNRVFANRFALIIGNEDYASFQEGLETEVNVMFARDDASAFREYARGLLGIPERNIIFMLDATAAEMRQGLAKINLLAKNSAGKAELFVFYAGHGLPDEATKQPYLIPVDVSGRFLKLGIPLNEFYDNLTEHPTQRVTVFLDACFSGGARNQGLVASRGVRITPKNEMLKGNMVVFTATDAEEAAFPYVKKNHGLFTYFLLQKLKETRGEISYKSLAGYLEENVPLESVIINSKEQHPKILLSPEVLNTWESWAINE